MIHYCITTTTTSTICSSIAATTTIWVLFPYTRIADTQVTLQHTFTKWPSWTRIIEVETACKQASE